MSHGKRLVEICSPTHARRNFLTLALPNRASADDTAHDIYREKLAIPEGLYTLEKGDADCEGTTAELRYVSVEKDISLILDTKYIFSNFN